MWRFRNNQHEYRNCHECKKRIRSDSPSAWCHDCRDNRPAKFAAYQRSTFTDGAGI
jgi:hypothetical protein